MSDGQRRDKPKFEPPPWEREAFERLARERAREVAVKTAASGPAPAPSAESAVPPPVGEAEPGAGAPGAPKAAKLDDAQVESMLEQLREQEAEAPASGRVAQGAGVVMAVIGAAMAIAGFLSLTRARGGLPLMGAVVVTVFGLGSLVLGAWVWMSSKRVKGS